MMSNFWLKSMTHRWQDRLGAMMMSNLWLKLMTHWCQDRLGAMTTSNLWLKLMTHWCQDRLGAMMTSNLWLKLMTHWCQDRLGAMITSNLWLKLMTHWCQDRLGAMIMSNLKLKSGPEGRDLYKHSNSKVAQSLPSPALCQTTLGYKWPYCLLLPALLAIFSVLLFCSPFSLPPILCHLNHCYLLLYCWWVLQQVLLLSSLVSYS